MKRYQRMLCALLCVLLTFTYVTIPVGAEETAPEDTALEETAPVLETALEENEPEEPVPEETVPQETVPEETVPEETVPQETVPEETVPEEPVPEETEPEPEIPFNPMPLFFQTDYPDTRYGSGTIASSGCSITSLAMMAGYLTGHIYFPDQLACWFGGKAQNNIARLEYAATQLRLPYKKAANFHETMAALQQGKVAIALMNKDSIFTTTQHFIVLCGMTEDGKILVNDPYGPNYDNWHLEKGLTYGFEQGDILLGYSGAWIFDKSEIPQEPFIYYEPELDRSNPRYPDIQLTDAELELLAKLVWVEAQGECFEGQQAVAEIVFNRLASPNFPDNLHSIIYGEGQFRSADLLEDAEPNQTQYDAIELAYYGPYILPEDVIFFAKGPLNDHVWGRIGGHVFCYYR